jgi:flagellar motor switch/type III secretory pathway protein FliN
MNADEGETLVDLPSAEEILAVAPVTVVAELGRVVVRGDELAGLVPGAVLSLGPEAAGSLNLRIEGQLWARGELVRVGDELAVRITHLTGG